MIIHKVIVSLSPEEISRLLKLAIDEDREDAFFFIKKVLKPQVDQVTRSQ